MNQTVFTMKDKFHNMDTIRDLYKEVRYFIPKTLDLESFEDLEEEILLHLQHSYNQLILIDEHLMNKCNGRKQIETTLDDISSRLRIVLDRTWEDLNTGHWSEVPESKRYVYSSGSLLSTIIRVLQAYLTVTFSQKDYLEKGLKDADMGLLLGCAFRPELTKVAQIVSSYVMKDDLSPENFKTDLIPGTLLPEFPGVKGDEVYSISCPSLETFFTNFFLPRKPVKLRDCMDHWPALNKWNDLDYLSKKAGERTVPVEIGSRYDDEEWSQSLMTVKQFIRKHIVCKDGSGKTGYLAQHQLFNQIPELLADIREPDYCCCSDKDPSAPDGTDINAWFGPAGTVSPLHYDPKHNILAQVVGRKRILLYDPKHSDLLSCHDSKLLGNTAQVDPENPDYKQFPDYKKAPAQETILNPGEMLYIPPTWWHHVRSFDVSFSVSFWWE